MLTAMRGLAIVMALAVAGRASADPVDATEAGEIFLRGRELAKRGQFAEACELFTRSYALEPALGTALNLADCLERQGQLRRAWTLFDTVARASQSVQSRARLARQRADALGAKLATVIVTLRDPAAAGLVVRIGDHEVTPVPQIRDMIEPGDVELVATIPGGPVFKVTLHAVAGATVSAEVPGLAAPVELTVLQIEAPASRRRSRVYVAAGLGAGGVVGLGFALGFSLAARSVYNEAFQHGCSHAAGGVVCVTLPGGASEGSRMIHLAGKRADLATGFGISGLVLAAAGAAVFFTAPRETIQIAPLATGHELGLGVSGRF